MDPLTAVGLAGSVVQFISFAIQLISKTKEVHASAKGQTEHVATIESIYGQLMDFSVKLEMSSKRELVETSSEAVKHVIAINDLSRSCEADCRRLLDIVRKLRSSGGRWQGFRAALKTVWKAGEIDELEERLHRAQTTLTLHLCSLTSYWHNMFDRQLRELKGETRLLDARQSLKLDRIADTLKTLETRITAARSSPHLNYFSPDDVDSLERQMSNLSMLRTTVTKDHRILKSLSFDSRPVRHSSIPTAYSRTLEWAFTQPEKERTSQQGDILTWLREGNGFFWVSGKPGSGKSTFMKYLADHSRTMEALKVWSSPRRLVVASHYFWSVGTSMQKSKQGLLQTLLYDIFRQLPDLIELTCRERWLKTVEELDYDPWLVPELQQVLQRISTQDVEVKFCFFIDGLDEFEGDHVDFCRSLLDLASSPHVKICVSSRAWNIFEDSFGQESGSKLYMHELTHDDIHRYTESRLQEHPRWKELERDGDSAWLVDQITERAAGVFLWVFLVTNQLRNGLTEYDTLKELRKRLESIPDDLEAFFKQILESVEPFYHEKMASTLLVALEARAPAPVQVYGFHDLEHDDQNYALAVSLGPLPKDEVVKKREQTTRRLNARCRGLVEVRKPGYRVEFLHRSVMDFLRTREMTEFLLNKAPSSFDANLSLLRAYTAYIKTTKFTKPVDRTSFGTVSLTPLTAALQQSLAYAKEVDNNPKAHELIDEMDDCLTEMQEKGQVKINILDFTSAPAGILFRELVFNVGLTGYISYVLSNRPDYFSGFAINILGYAVATLLDRCGSTSLLFEDNIELIKCLLENGYDPNAPYRSPSLSDPDRTPWKDLVAWPMPKFPGTSCRDVSREEWDARRGALEETILLMLKHGADRRIWPGHDRPDAETLEARVSMIIDTAMRNVPGRDDKPPPKKRRSRAVN
ncbi:hypothetical protein OQA88_6968 [Cercophora sp. LCS_1]